MKAKATRDDAVLGWVGTAIVAALIWGLFTAEPSDRGRRATEAARHAQEQQEIRAANCRQMGAYPCS